MAMVEYGGVVCKCTARRSFWFRQLKQPISETFQELLSLDIPRIFSPSDGISFLSTPLTEQNAFLLLNWIRQLNDKRLCIPQKFLICIKEGSWLKVTLNGSPDYRLPSQSFLLSSSWGNTLQNGSVSVDMPLIDKSFYDESISGYKEELKTIGVIFEYSEAYGFIGKHFMSLAASSSLTRGNMHSILRFSLNPDLIIFDVFQREIKLNLYVMDFQFDWWSEKMIEEWNWRGFGGRGT